MERLLRLLVLNLYFGQLAVPNQQKKGILPRGLCGTSLVDSHRRLSQFKTSGMLTDVRGASDAVNGVNGFGSPANRSGAVDLCSCAL